ncbi:hypothetical protein EJ994_05935 [Maribacter sp. MJ134]|uniref:hypothetical protein n=1 Tax=Maribacter sp. MJ134 TaxID=2496865 RepID=UPI000F81908B|nr:hypothetical protein [Maribacter sp. MJ134]AZQ58366.1 hypothetical protein EJ994_05935 [Maribacter sp. MJ134]
MNEKDKAILKNRILEFLYLNKSSLWGLDRLEDNYGKKAPSKGHFRELIKEMSETGSRYFDYNWDAVPHPYFKANDFTKEFLDAGGFVNQYESKKEADEQAARLLMQDERIKNQTEENLRLTTELNRQRLKTHWIPIIISLVGLGIAVASFFRPSNNPSKPVDDNRLQIIEMKMEQIENDLKKDLDS